MCICCSFIIAIQLATNIAWVILHPLGRNPISVLVLTSCFYRLIMVIYQQLGRNLISVLALTSHVKYHSFVLLILLYLAAPFFTAPRLFLFHISHIFDNIKVLLKAVVEASIIRIMTAGSVQPNMPQPHSKPIIIVHVPIILMIF